MNHMINSEENQYLAIISKRLLLGETESLSGGSSPQQLHILAHIVFQNTSNVNYRLYILKCVTNI